MGTMIELALGRLEIDWGKNQSFTHHGQLFQDNDLKQIPCHFYDMESDKPIIEPREGFGKPLRDVRDRVELLGHTPKSAAAEYAALLKWHGLETDPLPIEALSDALKTVDVRKVRGEYGDDFGPGEFVRKEILDRLILTTEQDTGIPRVDSWEISLLLENFSPYSALRLLSDNKDNLDLDVNWAFGELADAGWASRESFVAGAIDNNRFLIVTEGSSDAKIIAHAMKLLKPHIADFFRFVDMEEGYPFSGTGNLHRFAQGLVSIGLQNKALIVYDNDAEGQLKFKESSALSLPSNMRVMILPDRKEFESFPAIGPSGENRSNINGRAASIECYLDAGYKMRQQSAVRWTNFVDSLDCYQGAIENKTRIMKHFLNMSEPDLAYDTSGILAVLETIISECVHIAEAQYLAEITAP